MFDQILDLVKQFSDDSIVNNNEVPNEHNDAVMASATKSISRGIQGLIAQGNSPQDILAMFNSDGTANSPAAQGISANFIGSIMEKFGINAESAKNIAATVIPMVLSKITGSLGNNNAENKNDGGGLPGGIDLGNLGGILGKFFGK